MANELYFINSRCIETGSTVLKATVFDDGETLLEINDEWDNESKGIVMNTEALKELLGGIING